MHVFTGVKIVTLHFVFHAVFNQKLTFASLPHSKLAGFAMAGDGSSEWTPWDSMIRQYWGKTTVCQTSGVRFLYHPLCHWDPLG